MTTFGFNIAGVGAAARAVNRLDDDVNGALLQGVTRGVLAGQTIVRGNVSGRPGLRVITGDYRRRIVGEAEASPDGAVGQIGTNRVDSARHEFGFYGPDALGRIYNYAGFPHFQPAVPAVQEAVVDAVTQALQARFG